ncbi:hypothetical protein EXIGLDRAFT_844459 [Exidia glandulosa HHB12029]|uniref:RING-type domain-containing protein n=1 Tax=Exidia glandulosa HHB12029 TaxID=1314781 RepID=A0A165C0Z8_EXIGL|nr:hypothetical protein EXIGLDRAFT_844459 [Exidia glandulosa HHB12029]
MSAGFTYVDNVNTNLICCICRAPFLNPVTTRSCAHTFCLECIQTAISITPQCPVDRSTLTTLDLRPANPLLRNLVDELTVECPNASLGCTQTMQRQLVDIHLRDDCAHASVPCTHPGCERQVQRKELGKHDETCRRQDVAMCPYCATERAVEGFETHKRICGREEVVCPSCDAVTIRAEVDTHTAACPLTVVACAHSGNGCAWEGARHAFAHHIAACPYEAIKGFLSIHAGKVAALESENASLRRKVDELEGGLRAAAEEAQAARRSLGPWFRADASTSTSASAVASPAVQPQRPAPEERVLRDRRMSPLNAAMLGVASDAPFVPRTDPSLDASSFFPPFSPPSEDASSDAFPYGRALPAAPSVNINTTLEGSLTSLRNSIMTVSTSLDTMSRRHDVALMTETLRMHEEVQSLRAIVHGLRMQVHQIMMERSQMSLSNLYSSGQTRTSEDGGWSTRAEYFNDRPSTGPSMSVPLMTTVRRTTENKL